MFQRNKTTSILLMSINMSALNFSPLIGSTPFSIKYFSMSLLSKIEPETGERTGCSGTSFETVKERKTILLVIEEVIEVNTL